MNSEVRSVAASVKLHYEVVEDLLCLGATGRTDDLFMNEWALGTRKDVLESAIKLLTMANDDETIIIGIVPNNRDTSEKSQEPDLKGFTLVPAVWDHQDESGS